MLPSIFGENLFDDFFTDPFGMMVMPQRHDPLYGKHSKNLMKTDVRETEDSYELDIDLPGFKKEDVSVELKNGKRNKELCEKTYALLRRYTGDYCIESFNPFIVRWFKINAPEVVRGQLANPPKDYNGEVKPVTGFILGNVLLNFLARPQFIAYKIAPKPFPVKLCEALGAMKVCWTSHEWANEKGNDTVIFEFYKPKLKFDKH